MSIDANSMVSMADVIFLGVVALFTFYGFKRGVVGTLYSILRVYFSFIFALIFYEKLALLLQAMTSISSAGARIVCFTTLFIAFLVIVWTVGIFLKKSISKGTDTDNSLNKIGGCVLGFLEGILILSIVIMSINFYPVRDGAESPLENAISYKVIKQVAPGIEFFTIGPISRLKEISNVPELDESEPDSP